LPLPDADGPFQEVEVSISPLESTWMRTISPGQQLSIPTLIQVKNPGTYQINYSLSIFTFDENPKNGIWEGGSMVKHTTCNFTIQ